MANDFDQFPLYDPIVKGSGQLSDIWLGALSFFYQTLISYITAGGIIPPELTTAQRDSLDSPMNGQMIYNITADTMQYYKVSSKTWVSF